ncbi:MAG: LPS export ABC transporter periplasmic protein LptC [Candidatus Acidiferrales bacterium]
MRNQQAARYAQWAAWAAAAIALTVAGVYGKRAVQSARARRNQPAPLSTSVQQQSHEFSYSKTENSVTIFTIRASQATEYKDEDRTELKDVWITIFGRAGDRNDDIHTSSCSYEPKIGTIHCQGAVQINLAAKKSASDAIDPKSIQITTSNLSFNRASGEASTPEAVQFQFAEGKGSAVGVRYSTETAVVLLEQNVALDVNSSEKTGGLPIRATGGNLTIFRNERRVELGAPAVVRQGSRELTAQKIKINLDENFKAQHAVAEGQPAMRSTDAKGESTASATRFEASLDPAGWVQRVVGDGNVNGADQSATGSDHFAASQVEFEMEPQRNTIKTMTASGDVRVASQDANGTRSMKTNALLVNFVPVDGAGGNRNESSTGPARQRIESAETLSPATIEMKNGGETTTLRAKQFVTRFDARGHLDQLLGHSGVEIVRQTGSAAPQTTTSSELATTFDDAGEWSTLDQSGNVRFQQSDRQATAARARVVRATDMIDLAGSPVLSDSSSRTTAGNVQINQKTGEIHAAGGVVSTYLSGSENAEMSLGSGPGHVSADSLTGSNTSGHAVYSGHARLWQGESVLDAQQIELLREEKQLLASGNVVAVFPQATGPALSSFGSSSPSATAKPASANNGPTLWHIHAPALTYWSDEGKAHLETGVRAESDQGSMDSRTLDVFLSPATPSGQLAAPSKSGKSMRAPGAGISPKPAQGLPGGLAGGRQMDRALALGDVVVRQGDRRATAEQALYTAADGKFTLSGGKPTIIDASNDTTTGRSLTFFVANDTILIDSQEGSRTLTKHRVEK